MDPDTCRWVQEFLLMSSAPDLIIKNVWNVLPPSGIDSRLQKILLLRSIQSEVSAALFTESSLECLELIEEIDRLDDIAITQAMKEAYCAVAVECSLRYLEACPEKNTRGLFDDAVNRIWRGRVRQMMKAMTFGEKSYLFTAELIGWKDNIESTRWDAEVCVRLMNMNTRRDALDKVRVYLEETRASMGPSFLELAAISSEDKGLGSSSEDKMGDAEPAAGTPNEGCDKGVSESVFVSDQMNICEGRLHCSTNTTEEGLVVPDERALDNAAICMEKAPVVGGNQDSEQSGKRVVSSDGGNEALGGTDLRQRIRREIRKGKRPLERNHAVPSKRRGVKIIDAEEVRQETVCSKDHNESNIQVEKLRKSLVSSSLELRALVKDPLPDALNRSDTVRSELATKDVNHEPPLENQSTDENVPEQNTALENQSTDVNVPEQNTCRSVVLYKPIADNSKPIDDHSKKRSSASCSNVRHPSSWMERNSTAHTYEWDDAFDVLPGGGLKRRRKRWSLEEEDALRAGVKKFGKGNWKSILRFYRELFAKAGRTEVDLKDKWRNLTRGS